MILSAVGVVVGLSVLEGVARLIEAFRPPYVVDYGLGFTPESRVFAPVPSDPRQWATRTEKSGTFPDQQFFAEKPAGSFRVGILGGSSVHHLFKLLPQLESDLLAPVAGTLRDVEIINLGGMAYGTQRLIPVLTEFLACQPDLLVIYSGHNEFEEVEQLQLAGLRTAALQRGLSRSALVRQIRDRMLDVQVAQLRNEHDDRLLSEGRPNCSRALRHPFTHEDVRVRMESFKANLETMIQLCRQNGVDVILCTVPSNLFKPYLPKAAWTKYQPVWDLIDAKRYDQALTLGRQVLSSTAGRHQSSDLENGIARGLAEAYEVPLAEVEARVKAREPNGIPGETLFDDHCHLNEAGNLVLIATIQPLIHDAIGRTQR